MLHRELTGSASTSYTYHMLEKIEPGGCQAYARVRHRRPQGAVRGRRGRARARSGARTRRCIRELKDRKGRALETEGIEALYRVGDCAAPRMIVGRDLLGPPPGPRDRLAATPRCRCRSCASGGCGARRPTRTTAAAEPVESRGEAARASRRADEDRRRGQAGRGPSGTSSSSPTTASGSTRTTSSALSTSGTRSRSRRRSGSASGRATARSSSITVGDEEAEEALRSCLAKGADRAVRMWDDDAEAADPLAVGARARRRGRARVAGSRPVRRAVLRRGPGRDREPRSPGCSACRGSRS